MRIRFTRAAEQDIIENYLYGLTHFGQQQADSYESELRHTIQLISENPHIARERSEYEQPVRIHHTGKHYIVYLVESDWVLIVRVLRDEVDLYRHINT